MYLSFVLLMAGRGKTLRTVDWCVATACHYVMYCLPLDYVGNVCDMSPKCHRDTTLSPNLGDTGHVA